MQSDLIRDSVTVPEVLPCLLSSVRLSQHVAIVEIMFYQCMAGTRQIEYVDVAERGLHGCQQECHRYQLHASWQQVTAETSTVRQESASGVRKSLMERCPSLQRRS